MKETSTDQERVIVEDQQAAEVSQPSEGSFHNPAVLVPPHFPCISMGGPTVVATGRDDRFNASSHELH
jgi:hypothetical protein